MIDRIFAADFVLSGDGREMEILDPVVFEVLACVASTLSLEPAPFGGQMIRAQGEISGITFSVVYEGFADEEAASGESLDARFERLQALQVYHSTLIGDR